MVLVLAYITMVIDHVGYLFFPDEILWRIIGRLAFPLFARGIVRGYHLTSNVKRYAIRLSILAIISQIPAFFLFPWELNIIFTLLFGLWCIYIYERRTFPMILRIVIIAILVLLAQFLSTDYKSYWVLLILLLHIFWEKPEAILAGFGLTFFYYCIDYNELDYHFHIQLYAVFSLILLYFTPILRYDFRMNMYLKYGFYPFHLAVLFLIHHYLILQ